MDPLTEILTRFPKCRVTIGSSKPRPRDGDRRFFKTKGGWHVRRQVYRDGMYHVRNGRPMFEWVKEET